MDTDSFIVHVKTDDIYKDIAEDVEKRFDTCDNWIIGGSRSGKTDALLNLINHEPGIDKIY